MQFHQIIEKILGDPIKLRVYGTLDKHPEGLTGRGLAGIVATSPFKINQVLRFLVAQGLIHEEVIGRAHRYRINRQHTLMRHLLAHVLGYQERLLPQLGQQLLQQLTPHPLSVLLYGSVARGDEAPDSDIDIYLLYAEGTKPGSLADTGDKLSEWVAGTYGNPLTIMRASIHQFQHLAQQRDPLIRTIIREGKSIAGLSITEVLNYGRKKN